MKKYLALDIGGTDIKYGIITEDGDVLYRDKFPSENSKYKILDAIKILADKYIKKDEIQGIAISAPGIIDSDKGCFITAGALRDLNGSYFKEELEAITGLKVSMENDVNCVALAEKWLGNGKDSKNFICLAIGTGIGGAIVINGGLYRGTNNMAGEFGFMIGKKIENSDSRMASLSLTGSTQFGIVDPYNNLTNKNSNGKEIVELYKKGDAEASLVIKSFLENISVGIYNLIFALDPEKVLIGGAISADEIIIKVINEKVREIVNQHKDAKGISIPTIEACKFSNDSGMIGALYNFKIRN